jgi:hypothetical protein
MSSSIAITNEQVEKSTAWARAYYAACDSFDVRSWITKFYDSNSGGQFGNLPPVKGQEACITLFESIFNPFSSMKHTIKHIDVIPERLYLDIEVTVLIKNDPERKPIAVDILVVLEKKVDKDKATGFHIYIDPSPIFERVKMCTSAAS